MLTAYLNKISLYLRKRGLYIYKVAYIRKGDL